MQRRRFLFWISFGIFSLGEKLRFAGLDRLAAAMIDGDALAKEARPIHWRAAGNSAWRWYERETFVDGRWVRNGISTPISVDTGEPYTEKTGYLDPSLVPADLLWEDEESADDPDLTEATVEPTDHRASAVRRARHGRPPSKWLRSLRAAELRTWLATIDVPEAGVEGMTYWEHLTRDHFFDAARIEGLTEDEQARLHAAAHEGY